MTIKEIEEKIDTKEYDFLRTNEKLGNNIILLGLGGSHAYGTNINSSDVDVRGIALRSKKEILTGYDWEHVTNESTDTTIYSFDKMIKLLTACNPNTIEILGLKPEQYLKVTPVGQLLIDNKDLFLSRQAVYSFGGYAKAQLNRLINKSGRAKEERTNNEIRSMQKAISALERDSVLKKGEVIPWGNYSSSGIRVDGNFSIDSFVKMAQNILNVHDDYKRSTRNDKAVEHNKLGKHMLHLVRLYLMAFDILESGEIITYREKEHDLLMNIRNGKYLKEDGVSPTAEFVDMVAELENKLQKLSKTTMLPDRPDEKSIQELVMNVNEMVIVDCPCLGNLN